MFGKMNLAWPPTFDNDILGTSSCNVFTQRQKEMLYWLNQTCPPAANGTDFVDTNPTLIRWLGLEGKAIPADGLPVTNPFKQRPMTLTCHTCWVIRRADQNGKN